MSCGPWTTGARIEPGQIVRIPQRLIVCGPAGCEVVPDGTSCRWQVVRVLGRPPRLLSAGVAS